MTTMRAKLQVGFVQIHEQRVNAEGRWDPEAAPTKTMETLQMNAVCAPKYDATGLDEDNDEMVRRLAPKEAHGPDN